MRDFLGGAKITPEDFRKETGLSISEQKKFVGMISKQGKTIARLGEELADYDEWNLGVDSLMEIATQHVEQS